MKDLEKAIEEAALTYAKNDETPTDYFCYETLEDCWISGAKSPEAKEYWQHGMYSEEEVIALFDNWLNTKIKEELMRLSGELDSLSGVTFEDWFNQNKKK